LDGQPGGSEPDAARRSGYYHHLVFDGLQSDLHHASCNSAAVLPGPADPLLRGGIRRCVEGAFCMPVSESGSCTYEHLDHRNGALHMSSTSMRSLLLAITVIGLASCSGAEAETQTQRTPSDRLRTTLAQADSSAVYPLIAGDTLRVSAPVLDFYRRLRYQPAWTGADL